MKGRAARWLRMIAAAVGLAVALSWCLPAHADDIRSRQWHLEYLRMSEAHQISQGEGVTVALVDTGVDASHPDLTGNILPGTDLLRPSGDGRSDPYGHGTAMAGLIAAHGRDGNGALGIAPKAKIVPVAATTDSQTGSTTTMAEAIRWAAEHGAKVMCVAVADDDVAEMKQAVARAAEADVVVVAGVGNRPESEWVRYPAAYEGVVAAAGVDQSGEHAPISVTGKEVLLSAPAVDIWSTKTGGGYRAGSGTSDATAILAGVVALVRSKYPELSAREVVERLTATAVDRGTPGRDEQYGYGIVDPIAALTADVPSSSDPSAGPGLSPGPGRPSGEQDDHASSSTSAVLFGLGLVILVVAAVAMASFLRRRTTR